MGNREYPRCARCTAGICTGRDIAVSDEASFLKGAPAFCPMKLMPEVIKKAESEYDRPEIKEFARMATIQEIECYEHLPEGMRAKIPRVEELFQFAQKCGYKRLGLAFCGGLDKEAGILTRMLENRGFEVVSVRCKVGAASMDMIGVKEKQMIAPGVALSMCNPIVQAEVLNDSNVHLAIMLGLCIGHDTLFIKYCRVPMTVIAVKDRVFGHNPLAALYLSESPYYRRLMAKKEGDIDSGIPDSAVAGF